MRKTNSIIITIGKAKAVGLGNSAITVNYGSLTKTFNLKVKYN